ACRYADRAQGLRVIETIPAGYQPRQAVREGECARIMTGGMVPPGADFVVKVEDTEIKNGKVLITKKCERRNICFRAEDIKAGEVILRRGTLITAAEIAVLAAAGCAAVPVYRRPVVGIIATGSELVEADGVPAAAAIRDSNSYQLFGQVKNNGFKAVRLGIVEDTPRAIGEVVEREMVRTDLLLISGGVSMGEFDFVPGVLKDKGYRLLFEKVAIKPGKPTVFGVKEENWVFGLPGNPVSTFLIFEIFVKPFCFKLMGHDYRPPVVEATLAQAITGRRSDRRAYLPVRMDPDGRARKVEYHGSAHIHAFTLANGFIAIPPGVEEVPAGEKVAVTLIR
ncbi:MAG: molybdopterin molybdotransferase MoeA, partial [Candidatus Krumholzibacteriota bacterium]|nr:molybdopterin molybdotransferase MoeA [Candidatus Krumholzibacteriota bacterium]